MKMWKLNVGDTNVEVQIHMYFQKIYKNQSFTVLIDTDLLIISSSHHNSFNTIFLRLANQNHN